MDDLEAAGFANAIPIEDSEPDCTESEAGMGEPAAAISPDAADAEMGDGFGVTATPLGTMQKQMMESFSTMLATALLNNNVVLGTAIDNKLESALAPILEK